jgi:DNA-directed RNA polymerase subunit E'/Rpb7
MTTKINIPPKSMNKDINKAILRHLRREYEGKCIKDGYIKKKSISVLNKGLGRIEKGLFNGNIIYDIEYVAEVCNPAEGQILHCKVISMNKIGVIAIVSDDENQPIKVLLPKYTHRENNIFKDITDGNVLEIEVIGKRFELNSTFISVVGKLKKIIN